MRISRPIVAVLWWLLVIPAACSQGVPDLSGLDAETRELIENACRGEKLGGGPAAYGACLRTQLANVGIEPEGIPRRGYSPADPWTGDVTIAAEPSSDWPVWQSVSAKMPSAGIGPDFGPADLYDNVKGSVWVVVAARSRQDLVRLRGLSQGSAIVISRRSLLTSCHVIEGQAFIAIVQGSEVKEAFLTAADSSTDRCILSVDDPTLTPVRGVRRFSDIRVGERVYTVGAPSGLEQTFGEGIISGLRASKQVRFIQTTAPISRGSSGGGLFDKSGNLIGITIFLLKEAQAINFAIAAEDYWR